MLRESNSICCLLVFAIHIFMLPRHADLIKGMPAECHTHKKMRLPERHDIILLLSRTPAAEHAMPLMMSERLSPSSRRLMPLPLVFAAAALYYCPPDR